MPMDVAALVSMRSAQRVVVLLPDFAAQEMTTVRLRIANWLMDQHVMGTKSLPEPQLLELIGHKLALSLMGVLVSMTALLQETLL